MKHNTIRLYKHFCEMAVNPQGVDSLQRALVRKNAIKAKADMENHFKTTRKYQNDPEILALFQAPEEVKEEVKEDAKKSKR